MEEKHIAEASAKLHESWERAGRFLDAQAWPGLFSKGRLLTEIRIMYRGGDCMLIFKCMSPQEGREIAFISAKDVVTAINKAIGLYSSGKMPWKEDKPYNPNP